MRSAEGGACAESPRGLKPAARSYKPLLESTAVSMSTPDELSNHSASGDPRRAVIELAELAGGLAHELRNPLSTIMINLKLLAEELQDLDSHSSDVRRRAVLKVDVLRREAERLQSLFDEFLNLTGPYALQRVDVDLNLVLARLVEFCEPLLSAHHIRVTVDAACDPPHCPVDEKLLRQALLNIVINAQQSMPAGGELRMGTGMDGDCAFLAVADTGVGIPRQYQDAVFRPFFSTKSGGTGLGLSITQRIIHEHDGTLTFHSELGKGTTFIIRLPLH